MPLQSKGRRGAAKNKNLSGEKLKKERSRRLLIPDNHVFFCFACLLVCVCVWRQRFATGGVCSLSIDKAVPEDEGEYKCKVENSAGGAECSCLVLVDGKKYSRARK